MAKGQLITFTPGKAFFPALHRPDTRFNDLGTYKADVVLSAAEAAPFIKQLQAIAKSHTGKAFPVAKNSMFEKVLDDEGAETGDVLFKARVTNKTNKEGKLWDRRPLVIDAKKQNLPVDIAVWGGSTIRVQVEVYCWDAGGKKGISLQPKIVQVIDLKTGGNTTDTSAFDEVDDGYEVAETAGNTDDFSCETPAENDDY